MKNHPEHAGTGIIRQGDVMLVPIARLPKKLTRIEPGGRGRVVLAEGEVTGHAHALPFGGAVMFRDDTGGRYLSVSAPTALSHEEHSTHIVPAGPYRVVRQREFDDMEARRVAD